MHLAKLFLVVMKSGNNYCRLSWKAPEEDKTTSGLADAEDISTDATVAAVLSDLDGKG